jgi:hypothetical protein
MVGRSLHRLGLRGDRASKGDGPDAALRAGKRPSSFEARAARRKLQ